MSLGVIGTCCTCGTECGKAGVMAEVVFGGFCPLGWNSPGTFTGTDALNRAGELGTAWDYNSNPGDRHVWLTWDHRTRTRYRRAVLRQTGPVLLNTTPYQVEQRWVQIEVDIDSRFDSNVHIKLTSSGGGYYEWTQNDDGTVTTAGDATTIQQPGRISDVGTLRNSVYNLVVDNTRDHGNFTGSGEWWDFNLDIWIPVTESIELTLTSSWTIDEAIADALTLAQSILRGNTYTVWTWVSGETESESRVFAYGQYWLIKHRRYPVMAAVLERWDTDRFGGGPGLEFTTVRMAEWRDIDYDPASPQNASIFALAGIVHYSLSSVSELVAFQDVIFQPATADPDNGFESCYYSVSCGATVTIPNYAGPGVVTLAPADIPYAYGRAYLPAYCAQ